MDFSSAIARLCKSGMTVDQLESALAIREYHTGKSLPMLWRDHGELGVRFREDRVAGPESADGALLAEIRATMASQVLEFGLLAGGGYIINNRRWLHGRRAFTGERLIRRVLITETSYEVADLDLEPRR